MRDLEGLLAAAREVAQVARAHRAEGEAMRRLPDAVAEAFVERDLVRVLAPSDLGGGGADLVTAARLVEEVARADASAAWNFAIGVFSCSLVGNLPAATIRRLLGDRRVFIAGTLGQPGRAVAVEGGYRLSGRWSWGSGVHQTSHVVTLAAVFDGETPRTTPAGAPFQVQAFVPRESVTILDTWHVGGMRGTGSTDYTVEDVFIPAEMTSPRFGGHPQHPSPLFRLGFSAIAAPFAATALGVTQGAIDGLIELLAGKTTRAGRALPKDRPAIQYEVAKSLALVESGRLYFHDALGGLWEAVQSGAPLPPLEARARMRRAQVHAAESSIAAVDMVYRCAGGDALQERLPFERALRDVHAIMQQIQLHREVMEDAGRVSLGLPPLSATF